MSRSLLCIAALALAVGVAEPGFAQPPTARVIVKLKPGAKLLEEGATGPTDKAQLRALALSKRLALPLRAGARVSERAQVVLADGTTSEALAAQLARESDVEYAVPDYRRHALVAPNDPLYAAGVPGNGPAVGQWYLRAPAGEVVSSIDAERAWSITPGSNSTVVAVLDTGVLFDHPDLMAVANGGNLLPGFDMISDVDAANDGDGRDADASDPGDWLTEAEVQAGGAFAGCDDSVRNSSWHGTAVTGVIAALTDNGIGMASVGRNVRVLPVRVLGKCGGFDSDIIAGMRWAAGLPVPGVPANPTPARVVNLSLGSRQYCTDAYRVAIAEVNAAGTVVVAAAGNSAGHTVGNPANCDGAIAVAALRHVGTKVGFSDLGATIAISAPGGNCVNIGPGEPCLYPILTTTNSGVTTSGEHSYSDSFRITVGTSFSTPLVAGTTALMLSARPSLSAPQIRTILQGTARPFPTRTADPTVVSCQPPLYGPTGNPIDQLECLCTTVTCGAGMLDAGAAVLAAQQGVQTASVIEFYNAGLDHYFISWRSDEIAILDAGVAIKGWQRTGQSFTTYTTPDAGTSPVCRYYIPPGLGDSHFFGRGSTECEATGRTQPSLVLEDPRFMHMKLPSFGICSAGTTPVYRVFSGRIDANHRYLTDRALRDQMVAKGWIAEGDGADRVVMCAPTL